MEKQCLQCKKYFSKKYKYSIKQFNATKYCSRACFGRADSIHKTGSHHNHKTSNGTRWNHTETSKIKMGLVHLGEKHHNWKGGISKESSYDSTMVQIKRARKYFATGSHTTAEWEALKMKFGFMCLCCKKVEPDIRLTRDHIIPLSKGGSNAISNIQPLCGSCNSRKHTDTADYRAMNRPVTALFVS